MTERPRSRSGKVFFVVLLLCIVAAITATFLAANNLRNLNTLLVRFGFEPIDLLGAQAPVEPRKKQAVRKEPPRPQVELPDHLMAGQGALETKFIRSIRRNPRALCDDLQKRGIVSSGWKEGLLETGGWECSAFREYPSGEKDGAAPSSTFLSIRGSKEEFVTSFRIKLNIENTESQKQVTDAVIAATEVFLAEVRWNDAPEILDNIRALKEFDVVRFGNRIQLKREAGDTPRFNFLVTPDRKRPANPYLPDYFDRDRWLPLPDDAAGKR
ncbi:DUF6030 family protein [Sinorhizobium sp. BG8]|uniref:DUF6030 family protein n=1 Tax=Sinorhizobium sp. BG8 TaxID=2613773 RepID=UPI00193E9144|nr:DUF6030 family protein [Sinorhizobium sp. BG8]QRM53417.1 hypothetical protein F3Y30_01710 [Sinorhizobium sp. BG8]